MINSIYSLPEIDFIGGETTDLVFHVFADRNKTEAAYLDSKCVSNFSLVNLVNKNSKPLLSKSMAIIQDYDKETCILRVTLKSSETENLLGKYVYQIMLGDSQGEVTIPGQGIMCIHANINRGIFLRGDVM